MAITRRGFLRAGALGTVAVAAGATRAHVKVQNAGAPAGGGPAVNGGFELEEVSIAELQAGMESGQWTARDLVESYLGRIEALDRQGPSMNHVLETNPDALSIADALDAERKERGGTGRGPLHGIPILIKDNIATEDKMQTTAGSLALVGAKVPRDAFVVQRLRTAGAIVLGKTNLSEWANFRSTQSSSGWSARGGQAKNPYALDRSPCGSSSGSGGAAAASYCAAAIGTETDGSIVCPSGVQGIVGLKPTIGLVSRSGIVPIAHSQDTAGPMTRTVADAAALLTALTGADGRDAATTAATDHIAPDYTKFLDRGALKGARIGVARKRYWGFSPESDKVGEEALRAMKEAGATVVDPADIETAGDFDDTEFEVLLYEFKADLDKYLADLGPGTAVRSLADVIEFNDRHADREMPWFGQEIMHMAQAKGPLTERTYLDALARNHRLAREEGIDKIMDAEKLDALVAPTASPAWTIDLVNGDHYLGGSSSPAAVAGYPSITVPAGYVYGLPVGVTFFGRAWSERRLIAIAHAFEQATQVRRPPTFREHAAWG